MRAPKHKCLHVGRRCNLCSHLADSGKRQNGEGACAHGRENDAVGGGGGGHVLVQWQEKEVVGGGGNGGGGVCVSDACVCFTSTH